MKHDPDTPTPQPIPDEDIYAEVMKTHDEKAALRSFNTVLETYSNNLKERIEMKNQNEKPQQPKKPRNPKHRRYGFRKARLLREAEASRGEEE